jgi:hypothetical protein
MAFSRAGHGDNPKRRFVILLIINIAQRSIILAGNKEYIRLKTSSLAVSLLMAFSRAGHGDNPKRRFVILLIINIAQRSIILAGNKEYIRLKTGEH